MVYLRSAAIVDEMLANLKVDFADSDRASRVAKLYAGRSVLITGATGFIGKVLVEKLLRSCPDIKKIYLLIRQKRDRDAGGRLNELTQSQLFNRIRSVPGGVKMLEQKLHAIPGDITMENFGICADDMRLLRDQVSIVFNSAASVSFSEPIDAAVRNNIYSVSQLVGVCNQLANLEALVHLSTAYSNCNKRDTIHEIFYEPPMSGDQILRAVRELRQLQDSIHVHPSVGLDDRSSSGELEPTRDACDPQTFYEPRLETADKGSQNVSADLLDEFTRIALRRSNRPNSYTFTKAIAESYLLELVKRAPDRYLSEGRIPVAIVRPSIVGAAWREPDVGFVDNFNGCTAAITSMYTGALQAMPGVGHLVADVVPVDMVANMIVAAGCFLANDANQPQCNGNSEKSTHIKADRGVYIFNYASGYRNPLRWHRMTDMIRELAYKYPSKFQVRLCQSSYWVRCKSPNFYCVYDYLNHFVPAKLHEFFLRRVMRKQLTRRTSPLAAYHRIKQMTDRVSTFSSHQWLMSDDNVRALHEQLDEQDKQLFPFDIANLNWTQYLRSYVLGARVYALKDDPRNVPQALRNLRRRQLAYRSSLVLLALLFYHFFVRSSQLESTLIDWMGSNKD